MEREAVVLDSCKSCQSDQRIGGSASRGNSLRACSTDTRRRLDSSAKRMLKTRGASGWCCLPQSGSFLHTRIRTSIRTPITASKRYYNAVVIRSQYASTAASEHRPPSHRLDPCTEPRSRTARTVSRPEDLDLEVTPPKAPLRPC